MTELFSDISEKARKDAELAWAIAKHIKDAQMAGEMLNAYTNYACSQSPKENLREFLNFFFNLKLEELKKDEDSTNIG